MTPSNEQIARFLNKDQFSTNNSMRVVDAGKGWAKTEMIVEARHLNGFGVLQGGAVFTLADLAFAAASNSHGVMAVGCQADVTWFRAVTAGKLTAEAEEISRTKKLSTCVIRVTDEEGNLIALFKGVAYIKGTPLEW